MSNKIFIVILHLALHCSIFAQTTIQMIEQDGVYKVPCKVNDIKLNMIFDTGASVVCISSNIAEMMLENGKLQKSDFVNPSKAIQADGSIVEYSKVVLRKIEIGDIKIENVEAAVIHNANASLLFGQSGIQRLGTYTISGNKLLVKGGSLNHDSSDRWDEKSCVYVNDLYGFAWALPNEYSWVREPNLEKHTVFRASIENAIYAVANVQEAGSVKKVDYWDNYDFLKNGLERQDADLERKTGTIIYDRTYKKVTLLGEHAFELSWKTYLKDSRFDAPQETYSRAYTFEHNGYIYTISVKLYKELYDNEVLDCDGLIKTIFRKFSFTSNNL